MFPVFFKCQECGKRRKRSRNGRSRFCSAKCKQKAYRQRAGVEAAVFAGLHQLRKSLFKKSE